MRNLLLILLILPFSAFGMCRRIINQSLKKNKLSCALSNQNIKKRFKSGTSISKKKIDSISLKQKHGSFNYKTSQIVPEDGKYNSDGISRNAANYKFEQFKYSYSFYENINEERECFSFIDSSEPRDFEFSNKTSCNTITIDQEEGIEILFNKLNYNLRLKLARAIAKDLAFCSNYKKTANLSNYLYIDLLINQLDPNLQLHYKRIISELASKDPRVFMGKNITIKASFGSDYLDNLLITVNKTFIFLEKSKVSAIFDGISNLTSNIASSIQSIGKQPQIDSMQASVIKLPHKSPYELLNVTKDMSFEEIKESYFQLRLQYEDDKDMTELLKNAFEKIKKDINK